MKKME